MMDPFNNRRASRGRYLGRGRPLSRGGYRFVDSGAGVWTPGMRAEEAARRNAAQKAAADAAYADMEARIVAINSNGALTQRQKVNTLSQLRASGLSRREFTLIWEAKAAAEALSPAP